MAPVTELDLGQWRSVFENNVVGTMLTLKYGARELVRAGGGSFVGASGNQINLSLGGTTIYGTRAAGGSTVLTFGNFSNDIY